MHYKKWFQKTVQKVPKTETELARYVKVTIFGLVIFGLFYWYTTWLNIPSALNKAVADASVVLICLSMLLSAVCYFWDFADTQIIYRKHLGLIGFAFGVVHLLLSNRALLQLVDQAAWSDGRVLPVIAALIATFIFTLMTVISNNVAAKELGGKLWRGILRTGYIALVFVLIHVALLKGARWITWLETGMNRPPSLSLVVSVLIVITLLARVALWWSLTQKKAKNR